MTPNATAVHRRGGSTGGGPPSRLRHRSSSAFVCGAFVFVLLISGARAQDAAHAPGCEALIGFASREAMERPVSLTTAAGPLHQAVTTRSKEAQAYYDQGLAYLESYVFVEAARAFNEALRRDPALAMARLGLAKAYVGVEAYPEARAQLQQASEIARTAKASEKEKRWIALGVQQLDAMQAADAQQAEQHEAYKRAIDELIKLDPADPHAWVLRGNAEEPGAWGRGQVGGVGSIAYYEAALRRDPHHLGAHHFLVHSYENIGRYAEAAEHGRVYAAAAPGVAHAQHMYGHVLPRLGKWKEALAQFAKADRIERDYYRSQGIAPEDDWHHGHNLAVMGTAELRLGNASAAERLFREGFTLQERGLMSGGYAAPWIEYLLLRQRNDEALAAAQEAERRPHALAHVVGASLGGEAALGLGRLDEAKAALDRARAAAADLETELKNTPYARFSPSYVGPFIRVLEGRLALRGTDVTAGEAELVSIADEIAGDPRLDAWSRGLFRLSRLVADAEREDRPQLAAQLRERQRRIDPEFSDSSLQK